MGEGGSENKIFATMLLHSEKVEPCCCILKKLNFDLLTPTPGSGGGGLQAKYLLPC